MEVPRPQQPGVRRAGRRPVLAWRGVRDLRDHAQNRGLRKDQFILGPGFTPSGVVRIANLQAREGYATSNPDGRPASSDRAKWVCWTSFAARDGDARGRCRGHGCAVGADAARALELMRRCDRSRGRHRRRRHGPGAACGHQRQAGRHRSGDDLAARPMGEVMVDDARGCWAGNGRSARSRCA